MRNEAVATQDPAVDIVPRAPWRVARLEVLDGYRLAVAFYDGTTGEIDLARLINGKSAGVFAALRSPELFGQARVELGAVTWPNGLDLAPDAMHQAIQSGGVWAPE